MKFTDKILFLFITAIALFNCERTVYYHDRTEPGFTYAPNYSKVTDSTASIIWITDEACKSCIYHTFYENSELPDSINFDEFRQEQSYKMENLWPNVKYYCLVKIVDFYDNGPVFSDTLLFRTLSNEISSAWDQINANKLENAEEILANYTDFSNKARFTRAWLEFRQSNVETAKSLMEKIYSDYPGFLPNLAGLVVINHLQLNYDEVKLYSTKLLNINPTWNFVYTRADLNYKYLRLMLSEAYLNTGFTEYAQDQLDIVFPDNGLDPDLSDTWIVDSETYGNYESALIALINYLYTAL